MTVVVGSYLAGANYGYAVGLIVGCVAVFAIIALIEWSLRK